MMKATWCLCLVAAVLVAAAEGRAQSHGPKKRPTHSVSAKAKGREFLGRHRNAPLHPAAVPRSGRSRVAHRAEARVRRGVEDDPVEDLGNKKSARQAASRAIEELDALKENPVEGVLESHLREMKSHLTAEGAEEEKPQTPEDEGEQKGDGEEQTENRSVPSEAQQGISRSSPQATQGDRSTLEAMPGNRFSPQPPPADHFSSETGTNSLNPMVDADRFTPNTGIDSQVGGEGNKKDPSVSVKSKYDVSERGSKRVGSAAGHKNKYSSTSKDFTTEAGNKNRFSDERNRFTPEEADRGQSDPKDNRVDSQSKLTKRSKKTASNVTHDPGQASVTPGEVTNLTPDASANVTSAWETGVTPDKEGSMTSGEVGRAAGSGGSAGMVGTEPQWLSWYNTRPWRQEILSGYGEQARPSRKPYGL